MADLLHIKNPYLRVLLFLIIPIIGLWQLSLMQNTMKWDIMDQVYPWRYFISESLQNGYLPLWNPYQQLGYPISADPQSGMWYPIVWIISIFSGYSAYAINFEYLLHLFIAGWGMYKLIRLFKLPVAIAVLSGIVYQGCGFFISNAQHMSWIISAAWLPWVLYAFINLINQPSFKKAIIFAMVFAMMLLGGYPAFAIITAYGLLLIFLIKTILLIRKRDHRSISTLFIYSIIAAIGFLILTAGYLTAFYQALPHITRAETDLEQVLSGHFPSKALASLLFPLTIAKDGFFGSNLTLINVYIGLAPLIFFLYSFFIKKDWKYYSILALGIFLLLIAFGGELPFREILYHYVPLMDKFRFPTIFRIFSIVSFLMLSAFGVNYYFTKKESKIPAYIAIVIGVLILLAVAFAISKKVDFIIIPIWDQKAYTAIVTEAELSSLLLFQGLIQLLLTGFLIWLLFYSADAAKKFKLLFLLVIIDLIIAIQINVPLTVISDATPAAVEKVIDELPEGFPIPDDRPMVSKSDNNRWIYPMWYNMGSFYKMTAFDGYNPFMLNNYNKLIDSPHMDSLLRNSFIYLSQPENKVQITHFAPGHIEASLEVNESDTLVLSQAFYPGWQVFVDGKQNRIFEKNVALMATTVPAGTTTVIYKYNPPFLKILFYLSAAAFIVFILMLLLHKNLLQHRFQNII